MSLTWQERPALEREGGPLLIVVLLKQEVHFSGALLRVPVLFQPGRGGNLRIG